MVLLCTRTAKIIEISQDKQIADLVQLNANFKNNLNGIQQGINPMNSGLLSDYGRRFTIGGICEVNSLQYGTSGNYSVAVEMLKSIPKPIGDNPEDDILEEAINSQSSGLQTRSCEVVETAIGVTAELEKSDTSNHLYSEKLKQTTSKRIEEERQQQQQHRQQRRQKQQQQHEEKK